ncbi:MAG TPA: hypothetical protein VLG36_00510 [Candidatus Chromulinivoraceae bacterium]|nr:hypothetical protein [Candidatus Chromulinivoraceae bacterium]
MTIKSKTNDYGKVASARDALEALSSTDYYVLFAQSVTWPNVSVRSLTTES